MSFKKNRINRINDCADDISVKKTVFEWAGAVFAALAVLAVLFSSVYRISALSDYGESLYVFIESLGYSPQMYDVVIVSEENNCFCAKIIAQSGQFVSIDEKSNIISIDSVLIDENQIDKLTVSEISDILGDEKTVPPDFALVRYKTNGQNTVKLVSVQNIIGKAGSVIYPVAWWGENVNCLWEA